MAVAKTILKSQHQSYSKLSIYSSSNNKKQTTVLKDSSLGIKA